MNFKFLKSPLFHIIWILIFAVVGYFAFKVYARLYPGPTIADTSSTFIGFNHVGLTVSDLDVMLEFYQSATNYELLERINISNNPSADQLYGQNNISYEKAILKGPNMLLELTAFENQQDTTITKMPPQGPGMTHTCYQSTITNSAYDQFENAGTRMLSRGDEAIDLGGYGVTYAYGYDPEGNMMELEQMSETLIKLQIGKDWAAQHPIWMTQVAIISPNLPRLTQYYSKVLAIEPYRIGSYKDNPKFDEIADYDSLAFDAAWFGMDARGKKLELMQYVNPATPVPLKQLELTDLGYTFSFEVLDIQKEYLRLLALGVEFISPPQELESYHMVFAHDVDGNVYSLRQAVDPTSIYSLKNF